MEYRRAAKGGEANACRVVASAFSLITADTEVFKQINLSSAEGLHKAATDAVRTTKPRSTGQFR